MNRSAYIVSIMAFVAWISIPAQEYDRGIESSTDEDSPVSSFDRPQMTEDTTVASGTKTTFAEKDETTIPEAYSSAQTDESDDDDDESEGSLSTERTGKVLFNGYADIQVDKDLYEDYWSGVDGRFDDKVLRGYRKGVEDFWMRVGIKLSYRLKHLESVAAFRYYPYWTMRREMSITGGKDLAKYIDVMELTQAYIKVFKDYEHGDASYGVHFKVGRDGMLNSCGHLFGNYIDQPTGGYGESRGSNVAGPFKNRKVFANQIEAGAQYGIGDLFNSRLSAMIGNNLNNDKWYNSPLPTIYQQLDSKLSAGFTRFYLDFYFFHDYFHLGTGYRRYFTRIDSSGVIVNSNYQNANWCFDVAVPDIIPGLKFYTEFAFQKLGFESSKGVVRPATIGITLPTGKVLDTLAVEFENVARTFFSDESMRDAVNGRMDTKALGWGVVAEKKYANRVTVAWGVYTGNPTGELKTTLRLSSTF